MDQILRYKRRGAENCEWTREKIAEGILQGRVIFIYRSRVIGVPYSFLRRHPGGVTAIQHFIGRDATDEIEAFHSVNILKLVEAFVIGFVHIDPVEGWDPLVPPIMSGWVWKQDVGMPTPEWESTAQTTRGADFAVPGNKNKTKPNPSAQILLVKRNPLEAPQAVRKRKRLDGELSYDGRSPPLVPPPTTLSRKVQAQHSAAYKELHKRILAAGLYRCRFLTGYGPEVFRYVLLASLSAWAYSHKWFITSAVFLGLFWHQLTFTAHDLGHMGVTHIWVIDRLLAIFVADFLGGLSIGWWVDVRLLIILGKPRNLTRLVFRIITFIIVCTPSSS